MAKWAIALDGEKLLKKATLESAWTPAKLNDGANSTYGLGWGIGGTSAHRTVSHSGAHMTGFTSAIIRYRDDNLSIVVLTNSRSADPSAIARQVAALYNPALKPPPPKEKDKK
jgi:CubicO group peptidase (beta-lactamase class C family)